MLWDLMEIEKSRVSFPPFTKSTESSFCTGLKDLY